MKVSFRLLGDVGVSVGDKWLSIDSTMLRGLFACLLLHPNQVVSASQLRCALWHTPPTSVRSNLRTYAARLRRSLAAADPRLADRLNHVRGQGYRLVGEPDEFDHLVFRHLTRTGRRQLRDGDALAAQQMLSEALTMWTGWAGDGVPRDSDVRDQLQALNDSRTCAEEDLAEARLVLGDHVHLVTDLHAHISQHPLRERPYGLLMRALYVSGNPPLALGVYDQLRHILAVELGTDPSLEIQRIHRAILRHDETTLIPPGPVHVD